MEFFKDFAAIAFAISVVILLCNIVLFLVLVICIPTISGRIKNNNEIMEENSERIEKYLYKINKNLTRLNKNIENDHCRELTEFIDDDKEIKEDIKYDE